MIISNNLPSSKQPKHIMTYYIQITIEKRFTNQQSQWLDTKKFLKIAVRVDSILNSYKVCIRLYIA